MGDVRVYMYMVCVMRSEASGSMWATCMFVCMCVCKKE